MKKILCGRARCCPTIETTEYGYEIRDDFGGVVKLKKEELEKLKEIEL